MPRAAAKTPKSRRPTTRSGRHLKTTLTLSHGLFSVTPVIPGVESVDQWLAHLAGVLKALAPVGQLETLLAERIAFHFWRLKRIIRYETQLVTHADPDGRSASGYSLPVYSGPLGADDDDDEESTEWEDVDPAVYRRALLVVDSLDAVMFADDSKPVTSAAALAIVDEVRSISCDVPLASFAVPGLPDTPIATYDSWTAGLVRQTIRAICQRFDRDLEQQLRFVATHHRDLIARPPIEAHIPSRGSDEDQDKDDDADAGDDAADSDLDDADPADIPDGAVPLYPRRYEGRLPTSMPLQSELERLSRYESHISRQLETALNQLDLWQTRRLGRRVTRSIQLTATENGPIPSTPDSANEIASSR